MSRILITDDEPHVIRVLKIALEKHGYQVDQALNGELALEKIKQQQPDVLITDIQMPRLSGEALCKRLKEEVPQRKFLIFVLTSRTEIEHREWSSQIDNLQFLEKPVSVRKLVAKLNAYFANK